MKKDKKTPKNINENDQLTKQMLYNLVDSGYACPECHSLNIQKEGRCITCLDCFWSKCEV